MLKKRTCLLAAFLILFGLLPQRLDAGAWAQAKGQYYAKLSSISYSADEHYTSDGKREPLAAGDSFDADQVFLYVEYGATNRLTVVGEGNLGELVSRTTQERHSTQGIGDLGLGAKYQWLDAPVVLSPYVKWKIPTGYDSDDNPSLGTGDMDLEFRLLASKSLYPYPVYVGAELGLRLRGGPFSRQVPFALEIGVTPHKRVFAKTYLVGTNTLIGDGGFMDAMDSMSMQVSEGDFIKWGVSGAFKVQGALSVDLSYESIFSGENVGAGSSVGLGLSVSR